MPLKYRLVQRSNPRQPQAPKKFHAKAVTRGQVKLRQLAEEIAQISTLSTVDTIAVIEAFIQLIPKHLTQGEIVRLGDFGSFAIGLASEAALQEEAFNAAMIKKLKIYFRPVKQLKKALTAVEFEKV